MLTNLARIQMQLRKYADAEQALRRAAEGHAPLVRENALDFKSAYQLAKVFDAQAELFAVQNRVDDAAAAFRRALAEWKNLSRFPLPGRPGRLLPWAGRYAVRGQEDQRRRGSSRGMC